MQPCSCVPEQTCIRVRNNYLNDVWIFVLLFSFLMVDVPHLGNSGNNLGTQSLVIYGESASEVVSLTAAAALLECRLALVVGPAAARAALAKHEASIAPDLAVALKVVGSYETNEVTFTVTLPHAHTHTPRTLGLFQCMPS
jgi:hypothetical protein